MAADDADWRKLNLNDEVMIKLNHRGLMILKENHDELYNFVRSRGGEFHAWEPPDTDADGFSKHQLWHLFQSFGKHIYLGCLPPFETTIYVKVKDAKE